MTSLEQTVYWLCILLGMVGSFVCSGLETGVYTLNRVSLEVRAARRVRSAMILRRELEDPERLLATLLISNNVFGYMVALGATALLGASGYSEWAIVLITAAVLTPLIFVFTESVPKELFRGQADRLTYSLSYLLLAFRWALTGVLALPVMRWMGMRLARLLGAGPEVSMGTGRDRVAALLKDSAGQGLLSEHQASLVDRAMVFARTRVNGEMTPWSRVRPLSLHWGRHRILQRMAQDPHRNYPVADRGGEIVGVVRRLALLTQDAPLAEIMTAPVFLPPAMSAREALLRLGEARAELGIVGSKDRPLGIVTIRDLVEPLTGELPAW
jgi:putative hemolysin